MKKPIALIAGTAWLAVVANVGLAQLIQVETPEPPEPPEAAEAAAVAQVYDVVTGMFGSSGGTAGRTLIIPKEGGDPKELTDWEEDLNVMARILEKAVSSREARNRQAMGIWIHGGQASSAMPKNLCIEGYGALFFLNVNFPLVPPATKAAETETKNKTSTEWEEARAELYRSPGTGFEPFELDLRRVGGMGGPAEEYDADKVEDLKRNLISALKNAAHIRKLKAEEVVTVVVSGRGPAAESKAMKKAPGNRNSGSAPVAIIKGSAADSPGTKLILRARKSDIDAFQKDKLGLDEFRKKVTAITY
jgi:hypothetical protein